EIMERKDLEKWVMEHPQILGEDLLIITNEYDKFDKTKERLDLLALDRDGKLVVVELKRETSGKSVELQAIKYAAYCSTLTMDDLASLRKQYVSKTGGGPSDEQVGADLSSFIENEEFEELDDKPRIMLVASEFKPEVTASVLWLRKFGLDVSCIKLTPYKVDKDRIGIVSSKIIPLPEAEDYIIRSETKDSAETLTRTKKAYIEFYQELSKSIRERIPNISVSPAGPLSYLKIPTGIGGIHFEWGFHGQPRSSFGVELHFERANTDENKTLLKQMEPLKDQIEKETGENVIFQENWGRVWSRLYLEKKEGRMTDDLKIWAVDKMTLLYKLLQPTLAKVK
ncbi:MAG: DUF4268 domain-containing protein, partial [archaeon]